MLLRVDGIGEGLHPNEAVVTVQTVDGPRRLIVSRRSIVQDCIEVGAIREREDQFLVELPRETQVGEWRVWVGKNQVRASERAAV